MERYLRRSFLGQKQFSLEGLDVLIPMLDEAIELAAGGGAHEVVLGMAHRGRLNVLAHVVGRPYETILREFEGERTIEAVVADARGRHRRRQVPPRRAGARARPPTGEIARHARLQPEPPRGGRPGRRGLDARRADRPLDAARATTTRASRCRSCIHGDASFAGQGVVAETLNLYALAGYSTGGTLHLIANNQVGFTTDPESGRSTRYSSDLAKGFDMPIVHVNADDPEAALAADPARARVPARASATTSSSTSSATGASATTSRTRRRTRSR